MLKMTVTRRLVGGLHRPRKETRNKQRGDGLQDKKGFVFKVDAH